MSTNAFRECAESLELDDEARDVLRRERAEVLAMYRKSKHRVEMVTCDYCGDELRIADVKRVDGCYCCEKCQSTMASESFLDDDPPICSACNSSGEGMYDGTRCGCCGGRGVE